MKSSDNYAKGCNRDTNNFGEGKWEGGGVLRPFGLWEEMTRQDHQLVAYATDWRKTIVKEKNNF